MVFFLEIMLKYEQRINRQSSKFGDSKCIAREKICMVLEKVIKTKKKRGTVEIFIYAYDKQTTELKMRNRIIITCFNVIKRIDAFAPRVQKCYRYACILARRSRGVM